MKRLVGGLLLGALIVSCNVNSNTETSENDVSLKDVSPVEVIENPLYISPSGLDKISNKKLPVLGKSVSTSVSIENFFKLEKNKKDIYVYGFFFKGGDGGRVHFKNVNLPEGAKITIFDENGRIWQEISQFKNQFWTGDIKSKYVYIKVEVPKNKKTSLQIDKVIYIWGEPVYPGLITAQGKYTECPSQDIACETDDFSKGRWKYVHATSMYSFTDGMYLYQCSGSLILNHSGNPDPIFITSAHCIDNDEEAKTAAFWFDFKDSKCNSYDGDEYRHYVLGAKLLDVSPNDIALLQITGNLEVNKYTYQWIKWDNDEKISKDYSVFGISYPLENPAMYHEGYIVKPCYLNYNPEKGLIADCRNVRYRNGFKVNWDIGSIDFGSSGSPLLYPYEDNEGKTDWKIIGVLSAKEMGCNPPVGIYSDFYDYIKSDEKAFQILENGLPDDKYEENDFQNQASSRLDNPYKCSLNREGKNLVVKLKDEDWYRFYLPKGCKLLLKPSYEKERGKVLFSLLDKNGNMIDIDNDGYFWEYTSDKKQYVFLRVSINENTYQNYSLKVKKIPVNPNSKLSVKLNLDSPYLNKIYYTFSVDIKSDKYRPEDFKICKSLTPYECNYWFDYQKKYYGFVGRKEKEYRLYVWGKDPEGKITNIYTIKTYVDRTPPEDGSIAVEKRENGLLIKWSGFRDKISGIKRYKLVYSEKPIRSCREGKVVYKGKNTQFFHSFVKTKLLYYSVCAEDLAGNWSKGTVKKVE